jgi:hypothetical protein
MNRRKNKMDKFVDLAKEKPVEVVTVAACILGMTFCIAFAIAAKVYF